MRAFSVIAGGLFLVFIGSAMAQYRDEVNSTMVEGMKKINNIGEFPINASAPLEPRILMK